MARIPDGYVTIKQVMKLAGVTSRKQIRKDIDNHILPLHRIPSQKKLLLFKEEEAKKYIEEWHTPKPCSPQRCG